MNKKIFFGLLILALAALVGAYYYFLAPGENGFKRKWTTLEVSLDKAKTFEEHFFFAFARGNEIWLNKRRQPLELLTLNTSLKNIRKIALSMPDGFDTSLSNYYFRAFMDGILVSNEHRQLVRLSADTMFYQFQKLKFDDPTVISGNSVVVRSFKHFGKQRYLELVKLELSDSAKVKTGFRVPRQVDGVFCADGKLEYDPVAHCLYYMYYRRGSFICLDTNLNVIYYAKTIDTISRARVRYVVYSKRLKGGSRIPKRTLSTPGNLVNKAYSVDGGCLYILSGLRSDDQGFYKFAGGSTIDVYTTKNGTYLYSFMIPKYQGLLLRQFHVKGNLLTGIYDNNLVTYRISRPLRAD